MSRRSVQIRYRAEVAGRHHRYAYSYESMTDAREFLNQIRPAATSQVEALMRVDPALTPEQASAAVDGADTAPPRAAESTPR